VSVAYVSNNITVTVGIIFIEDIKVKVVSSDKYKCGTRSSHTD
jgi:hypothetical protein